MKLILIFLSSILLNSGIDQPWLTNLNQAKKIAVEKNELILLNFSGSDWCGPCMRMRKEIFGSSEFKSFANDRLVLVNADFPRSKKNKLSKEQAAENDSMAEQYNSNGKFPFTLLLTADGKILNEWEGLPDARASEFVEQIKKYTEKLK